MFQRDFLLELERLYLNPWGAFRDERKIKDFNYQRASWLQLLVSTVKVTLDMEVTVKVAEVKQIKHDLKGGFNRAIKIDKCSIFVKPNHTSKEAPLMCFVEKYRPVNWDSLFFSCIPLKFTSWAFCLWIELCVPSNSVISSVWAVQIYHSKM